MFAVGVASRSTSSVKLLTRDGSLLKKLMLLRILNQQQNTFRDAVGCGFVTRDQQLLDDREHFSNFQGTLIVQTGIDDVRDNVVLRVAPALFQFQRKILLELHNQSDCCQVLRPVTPVLKAEQQKHRTMT